MQRAIRMLCYGTALLTLMSGASEAAAQEQQPPTRPPAIGCNHEGCVFGEDGQEYAGFKYSNNREPEPASVGSDQHVSYLPPNTVFRVRVCVGSPPFRTSDCGPAAEVVTPSPPPSGPEEIIHSYFGAEGSRAVAVARCESGLRPDAVSPGGGNHGLFQINSVHRSDFERVTGKPWSAVYDADANTKFARWLWGSSGWGPWSCKP